MTPTRQQLGAARQAIDVAPPAGGDRVVISGMAGLYPQSRHVKDLENILYNKFNPITADHLHWNFNHPEVVQYQGNVPELNRFDAQFFKVSTRQGHLVDPTARKLLEQAYAALYDAGVNPEQLNGKRVGVFVGTSVTESEMIAFSSDSGKNGLVMTGCSKTMFANRISYWLNVRGPSMNINESCCSSTAALEQAYQAIARGECEAAIVGGAHVCLHPQSAVHFGRVMTLAADGRTKSFDQNAAGTALSEAINVLFLQKAKDALRIYADVLYVKCEFTGQINIDGDAQSNGFYRNRNENVNFLKDFYTEAGVRPDLIEYVEAFGAADQERDRTELETIDTLFCKDKKEPLLVGSVMSNIGYAGAATGISAVTKVLLGYHRGELAGNLHCETPRTDVAALREGRIRIVNEHKRFRRTYAAVNNMSLTGINGHVLLHGNFKSKDIHRYKANIPRLVNVSGRQDAGVTKIFEELKSHPIDPEQLSLLHNIHETKVNGHLSRGFIILDNDVEHKTLSLSEKVDYFDDSQRQLWFVYSGMGSQWAGMGAQLMRIPIFAAAIERCRRALEPKGIDIVQIITSPDKSTFDNILHSFVGIAAIQIGLTDVLNELGLVPDKIIGHSVGELGCAYADGCLTAEEMILSAYSRGLVSLETPFIRGSMAAIGVGFEQMSKMCPPEIDIACHNSAESCTISGPEEAVRSFVANLTAKNIFAKEVPCSNIAYHSRYITEAGPVLLQYLREVIKTPRARSERWMSTSVPQDSWDKSTAKYSSAEYHTNNLLSPVLFEETSRLIPATAVLVEVAPHGLLQAILKRALPQSCINIPLTRRGHPDNVLMVLEAVGMLFIRGFNPKIRVLYPKVHFPVSTGTPFLSHFIEWMHEEKWSLVLHFSSTRKIAATCEYLISVYDDEHIYLKGHVIREKPLVPFSLALVAAWDTLAMTMNIPKKKLNVSFRNIQLYSQPMLYEHRSTRLSVSLHRGNGWFEIMNDNSRVATGYINQSELKNTRNFSSDNHDLSGEMFELGREEAYQLFREKEYSYNGAFCSIESVDATLTKANLIWNDNWVTLIDGIIQLNALKHNYNSVSPPDRIGRITINVEHHLKSICGRKDGTRVIKACVDEIQNFTSCGGIVIEHLQFNDLPSAVKDHVSLKSLRIVSKSPSDAEGMLGGEHYLKIKEKLVEKENAMLKCEQVGDFNSLQWVQTSEPNKNGISVKVHYAGLNVNDVKKAAGVIANKNRESYRGSGFGMEFSGLTGSGERVMGLVEHDAVSSYVTAQSELLWPVPSHWTLEDAATVPFAYIYAYYCLYIKVAVRLVEKHITQFSVLVHGGAGALGQAMISIALAKGYKVFATVSDLQKKRFLLRLFPELHENDIGNSRDASFGDMVMSSTNSKGCNIVLCCLQGELKHTSLYCCGSSGTTFDTVLINNNENYQFGMHYLTNERAYIAVDVSSIFSHLNSDDRKMLQTMLSDGIARGHVRPLSRVTFAPHEAPRAFRLLAASRHRGRVLLKLHDSLPSAQPRFTCTRDRCHLILCDKQSLGLLLVDTIISCGANRIHIHIDKLPSHLHLKLDWWATLGVRVSVSSEDLTSDDDIFSLLHKASNLGPLDGVYVIAESSANNKMISELDQMTRKFCPSLQKFVVLSKDGSSGRYTCTLRARDGLPATMLDLSMFKAFYNTDSSSWHRKAIEATALALRSADPLLLAQPQPSPQGSLLQQIAALGDINITDKTLSDTTLKDLGLDLEKSQAISTFLSNTYHISLFAENIMSLTTEKIKQIEDRFIETDYKEVKGLGKFFSYVDPDELMATTEIVFLPTLTTSSNVTVDEFSENETFLCIVSGLEGHHARFRALCECLKLPAFVLQPGLDRLDETPQEIALRYAKMLEKKTGNNKTFYLLGYEYGVTIALELATILEQHGKTGTVFCLGDGPAEVQALVEAEARAFGSEEALQDGVARHMFALMARGTAAPAESLRGCSSWRARVDACVRTLLGHVSHSAQYARALVEAAYARIGTARRYNAAPRALRSRLVLLRARRVPDSGEECSLQRYSRGALVVADLAAPMAHAAADLQVPAIINRHLDDAILQAFEEKNLCESYFLNRDLLSAVV